MDDSGGWHRAHTALTPTPVATACGQGLHPYPLPSPNQLDIHHISQNCLTLLNHVLWYTIVYPKCMYVRGRGGATLRRRDVRELNQIEPEAFLPDYQHISIIGRPKLLAYHHFVLPAPPPHSSSLYRQFLDGAWPPLGAP